MTYRERLNYWAVVRQLPNMQRIVIARFHDRSDADGHSHILQQLLPAAKVSVIFDLSDGIKPEWRDR